MHGEQPASHENNLSIRDTNMLQARLIQKSDVDAFEWIEKNASKVRAILNANPHLADLYRQDPDEVEDFIAKELGSEEKEN